MSQKFLGAYLQIFNNSGYPEFAIGHFRKHYPDSPIYVVSDAGYDFSKMASSFRCKYEHSNVNVFGVDGFTKEQFFEWLGRLKRCFDHCDSEFVIYLEDDIFTRGTIYIDPNTKISGYYGNLIDAKIIEYFKHKYSGHYFNHSNYGACGGTIYHRETFLENYEKIVKIIENDFCYVVKNISRLFSYFDCTMAVIYMAIGYGYKINENLIGTEDFPLWRNSTHSLVHIQKISRGDRTQSQIMREFPV